MSGVRVTKPSSQVRERVMRLPLHRSLVHPEDGSDVADRPVLQVPQHRHRPLPPGQTRQGLSEVEPVAHDTGGIGMRDHLGQPIGGAFATEPGPAAVVHRQPGEDRAAVRAVIIGTVRPGPRHQDPFQSTLDEVVGAIRVAAHRIGEPPQPWRPQWWPSR